MNREVFLSLLSMDAYNRGYGQNVNMPVSNGMIGNASILIQSNVSPGSSAVEAGFYAIAYQWNGQTVISYRGTNPDLSFASADAFLNSPLVKDMGNGWALGAGFAGVSHVTIDVSAAHR